MGKNILIVEDEKNIVDILNFNLRREGYETMEAYDGERGLELALKNNPDLILLDVMLPRLNGFDVCRKIREQKITTPVIILTAREEEADKVLGLEIGADDYITKPFSVRELMARVKANIRRTEMVPSQDPKPEDSTGIIVSGRLRIDSAGYEVRKDGRFIELTQREYELLRFLAARPDKVFSRDELMNQVWNYDFLGDVRTVDVTVRRLREKIEKNPAEPEYIITRRGVGYLFSSRGD
ncbi:response regulator [Papillibacter cinnamivorans]|uniref:Stage 0 sporulation protein A homolog n=1 Tax=Papillibacter cinnamivorans DSM 12816 TaxID=1122930 RepID=A0A1W2CNT1_9FIRM|nr:response regulator [Papillibacter cinnamivorans]SMC86644.1 two-component system, OmpR family, response regulator VicR [Papillibacter cinnamivorans DSM 12816]